MDQLSPYFIIYNGGKQNESNFGLICVTESLNSNNKTSSINLRKYNHIRVLAPYLMPKHLMVLIEYREAND